MWLFTKDGFFSVVQKPHQVGTEMITIRSRDKKDLLNFLQKVALKPDRLLTTPHADYECRVDVPKSLWAGYLAKCAEEIDYDNFKHMVEERDQERAHIYLGVWSAMLSLSKRKQGR